MGRTVLHVDMDAFYAAIEQRDNPALRGRPLIVGGDRRRGVVLTASYEARPFGVGSAMPMARALRLCPHALVVPPRMAHYATVSEQLLRMLQRFSPAVEPIALDEAFLDISGQERLLGDGRAIARSIKQAVRAELGLCASVGIATSKFVAKVASDSGKPDGLVVVEPGREALFLAPLPVGRLLGVGRKTEALLWAAGVTTVAQLLATADERLFGALASRQLGELRRLAVGDDPRPVVADRAAVTIGSEETLDHDTSDRTLLAARLLPHADRVAARLRAHELVARVVVVKVKYADFVLRTRRLTLPEPTADGAVLATAARALLDRLEIGPRRVRLIGLAAAGLVHKAAERQLSLAPVADSPRAVRGEEIGRTMDAITARFGHGALRRASDLPDDAED
jgi:DNA polymerase-4